MARLYGVRCHDLKVVSESDVGVCGPVVPYVFVNESELGPISEMVWCGGSVNYYLVSC